MNQANKTRSSMLNREMNARSLPQLRRHRRWLFIGAPIFTVTAIAVWIGWSSFEAETRWALLMEDGFTGKTLSKHWIARGGEWRIEDGKLSGASDGDGFLLLDLPVIGDVRLEVTVQCRQDDTLTHLESAVFCNASKSRLTKDGYFASFGSQDGVKLQRFDLNMAFNRSFRPEPLQTYRLRLERINGSLRFYIDDKPVAAYWDAMPVAGGLGREYVGLYIWNARTFFDDVRVYNRGFPAHIPATDRGHVLFERGYFGDAADEYAKIRRVRPSASTAREAAYYEALSWLEWAKSTKKKLGGPHPPTEEEEKRLGTAAQLFNAIIEKGVAPWQQYAQVARGEVECERGNFERGIRMAIVGADNDPILRDAVRPLLYRYYTFLHYRRFEAAEECVRAIERLYPEDRENTAVLLISYAGGLVKFGRFDAGRKEFERIMEQYPQQRRRIAEGLDGIGHSLTLEGRFEEALSVYDQILLDYTDDRDLCFSISLKKSRLFVSQGRYDEAMRLHDELRKKYANAPELDANLLMDESRLYDSRGDSAKALKAIETLLERHPSLRRVCARGLIFYGNLLVKEDRDEEAEAVFQKVRKEYRDQRFPCAEALLQLGSLAAIRGKHEAAIEIFDQVDRDYRESGAARAQAWLSKGSLLRTLERDLEATELFERVLKDHPELRPHCARAFMEKGTTHFLRGRFAAAEKILAEMHFRYNDQRHVCASAMLTRAKIHFALGQDQKTIETCLDTLKKHSDSPQYCAEAEILQGQVLARGFDYGSAIDVFVRISNQYPSEKYAGVEALLRKGDALAAWGRKAEAQAAYLGAVTTHPGRRSESAWVALHRNALHEGRDQEAETYLEKLLEQKFVRDDTVATVRLNQGRKVAFDGRDEEAATMFKEIEERYPNTLAAGWAAVERVRLLSAHDNSEVIVAAFRAIAEKYAAHYSVCAAAIVETGAVLRRGDKSSEAESVFNDVFSRYSGDKSACAAAFLELMAGEMKLKRTQAVSALLSRSGYLCGESDWFFGLARAAVATGTPQTIPPADDLRRNDYEFAVAAVFFAAGRETEAAEHLRRCLHFTWGKSKWEWPAVTAREVLAAWDAD